MAENVRSDCEKANDRMVLLLQAKMDLSIATGMLERKEEDDYLTVRERSRFVLNRLRELERLVLAEIEKDDSEFEIMCARRELAAAPKEVE